MCLTCRPIITVIYRHGAKIHRFVLLLRDMDKQDAGAIQFYGCMLYADGDVEIVSGNIPYLLDNLLGLLTGWREKRSVVIDTECKCASPCLVCKCGDVLGKAFGLFRQSAFPVKLVEFRLDGI